jgi:hypothetical protein
MSVMSRYAQHKRDFDVIMAVSNQIMIFYDVTSCNVVDIYQHFGNPTVLFYHKSEAAGCAETSVPIHQTTRHSIPQHRDLNSLQ